MPTTCDCTIDGIKFILICLVVIGHSLEPTRYTSDITGWIYAPIYLVHMPLFVLISGYFSKNLTWDKFKEGSIKSLETYFFSSLIAFVFINRSFTEFLYPSQANWYLIALVFWRLLIFISSKLKIAGDLLGISIVTSLIVFTIPTPFNMQFMAIGRVLQFLPFFVLGYILAERDICELRAYKYDYLLHIVAFVLCITAGYLSCRGLHLIEFHRSNVLSVVDETGLNTGYVWLLKVFVEFSAIILSMTFLSITTLPSWLCNLGKYSLQLYVIQILFIQYGIRFVPRNAFCEIIIALCCILISIGVMKSRLGQWITNPISNIIKLKNETK